MKMMKIDLTANAVDQVKAMRNIVESSFFRHLEESVETDAANYEDSDVVENDQERAAKDLILAAAMQFGADRESIVYQEGTLHFTLRSKDAVDHFSAFLDQSDVVDDYEVDAVFRDGSGVARVVEFEKIEDDRDVTFDLWIHLDPEIVSWSSEGFDTDMEESFEPENVERLYEIRRRIKVNFRGKRRIKMQCKPGFKWDAGRKACLKISGGELARKRKSIRRAVITRKSKGAGYRARVLRKTRRAKKFRSTMGL